MINQYLSNLFPSRSPTFAAASKILILVILFPTPKAVFVPVWPFKGSFEIKGSRLSGAGDLNLIIWLLLFLPKKSVY